MLKIIKVVVGSCEGCRVECIGSRSYPGFIGSEIRILRILSSSEIFGGCMGWQLTGYLKVH